jgi:glutaconate CoA-transferase subunit B
MSELKYSPDELIVAAAARYFEDNKTIFVGTGLPVVATALAQKLYAPNISLIFEGGAVRPILSDKYLTYSPNDARSCYKAIMQASSFDVLSFLQRGFIDYGVISGAQVDQYGNVNTSFIGDYRKPTVKLPGSGGANDIASLANRILIIMRHEKRRFVEKVDFITSPGNIDEKGRESHDIIFGKPLAILTNLALMEYDPQLKRAKVKALQPGVTLQQLLDNLGFKPIIPEKVEEIAPPTEEEIKTIREIDPRGVWVKRAK